MAYSENQLSAHVDQIYDRLAAVEAQLFRLSQAVGVPYDRPGQPTSFQTTGETFVPPLPGPVADPRWSGAPDPRLGGQAVAAGTPSDLVPPEIHQLALAGKKIEAIKRYRELTNCDLKTAKRVVDSL
jgi:hypothetical protein